jgi:hypothetical protein
MTPGQVGCVDIVYLSYRGAENSFLFYIVHVSIELERLSQLANNIILK